MVPKECKQLSQKEEWEHVLKNNKVVAIIEGTIDQPLHKQNQEFIATLKKNGVKFVAVDVSQKQELLKEL